MKSTREAARAAIRTRCALVALLLFAAAVRGDDDLSGRWRGVVELAAGTVEITVDLRRADDGWKGTVSAPSLELVDLELSEFEVEGRRIAFTAAALGNGVRLTGELDAGGRTLRGESVEGPPDAPPATDIFLFEVGDLGDWRPAAPENITDRDGYDNQPYFLPDGSGVLYTSIRGGQADIYRYALADGSTRQVTDTPESEYSPTPMPGGGRFSTVRVEADGTQRLWSFTLAGEDPELVLEEVQPVGYHAWMEEGTLALFVLGDPHTLQLADVASGATRQVASGIGRSLLAVPGRCHLSFVHKLDDEVWRIEIFDPWVENTTAVVETRAGSEDLAWTAGGRILMGEDSKLYLYDPDPGPSELGWVEVADLESVGVSGITRLALSPDQRHLAVVGERAVPPRPASAPRPFALERQ